MEEMPKPQMKFRAVNASKESLIYPACPHSTAWFESMNRKTIKPTELHWVGKMGIEVAFVSGNIREVQNIIGKDKIDNKGVLLMGKFDMLEDLKK